MESLKQITVVPDDCGTLEEAIRTTADDGTVLIRQGKYSLDSILMLERNIHLKGETGNPLEVVLTRTGATALYITAELVELDSLTVECPGEEVNELAEIDDGVEYKAAIFIGKGKVTVCNCDVSSAAKSAFAVRGNESQIVLQRTMIHDTGDGGIFFDEGGTGTIEECRISNTALSGVDVETGGFVTVRRTTIFAGESSCVCIHDRGNALFENCDLQGNYQPAIFLIDTPKVMFQNCIVHDTEEVAILVTKNALLEMKNCEIYDNRYGIGLMEKGGIILDQSSLHDNMECNVYVSNDSGIQLTDCELYNSQLAFQREDQLASIELHNCNLHHLNELGIEEGEPNCRMIGCEFNEVENGWMPPSFDDEEDEDDDEDEDDEDDNELNLFKGIDFSVSNYRSEVDADAEVEEDEDDDFLEEIPEDFEESETRLALLETLMSEILGPMHDVVVHSIIPYSVGGGLDLYCYPNFQGGTAIATQEMSNSDFTSPRCGVFDSYELAMVTRLPCDLKAVDLAKFDGELESDDESKEKTPFGQTLEYYSSVLNSLARYIHSGVVIRPRETLEFPSDYEDEALAGHCFTFDAVGPSRCDSRINNKRFGILVVIEIFRSEMEFSMKNSRGKELLQKLKANGDWPFSDLNRKPAME